MIDRTNNTWHGVSIRILFNEFEVFNADYGIGPGINWLITQGQTTNRGRAPFHIRTLRNRFYKDLATDYLARIEQPIKA